LIPCGPEANKRRLLALSRRSIFGEGYPAVQAQGAGASCVVPAPIRCDHEIRAHAGLRHCLAFEENLHDDQRVRFDNYKTKRSIQNVL